MAELPEFIIPPKPEPVEVRPSVIKHLLDMTEEEREAIMCPRARESHERYVREGLYHCKGDRCKEMKEKKEKEEKEKETLLRSVTDRNKVLEAWARDSEAKQKKMSDQIEKMASLIAQLIPK
jgi:succinylglutamate desuccinylase